jgi:hypothetical protein
MKKAKIMLASIALFAVIGGAFAFKAHNAYNASLFCASTTTVLPVGSYVVNTTLGVTKYCTFISTIKPTALSTVVFAAE